MHGNTMIKNCIKESPKYLVFRYYANFRHKELYECSENIFKIDFSYTCGFGINASRYSEGKITKSYFFLRTFDFAMTRPNKKHHTFILSYFLSHLTSPHNTTPYITAQHPTSQHNTPPHNTTPN